LSLTTTTSSRRGSGFLIPLEEQPVAITVAASRNVVILIDSLLWFASMTSTNGFASQRNFVAAIGKNVTIGTHASNAGASLNFFRLWLRFSHFAAQQRRL
jgi:hypothetical protein